MNADTQAEFDQRYQTHLKHLKHLKLKGLQPKTIDTDARAIRRMGEYFDYRIDKLSPAQSTDYFSDLVASGTRLRRPPKKVLLGTGSLP